MKSRCSQNYRKKGQGVVEFALVSIIFLNLFLLTLNGVLAFTVHQYISYATFMAARAFQASQETPGGNEAAARATLDAYFDMPGVTKELARVTDTYVPSGNVHYGVREPTNEMKIRVEFEVPLLPFQLGDMTANFGWITLESVSYLGREPSVQECRSFFQNFYNAYKRGSGTGGVTWTDKGMDDNNC